MYERAERKFRGCRVQHDCRYHAGAGDKRKRERKNRDNPSFIGVERGIRRVAATRFAVYHFKGYFKEDDSAGYVKRAGRYSEKNEDKTPAERKNQKDDTGYRDCMLKNTELGFALVAATKAGVLPIGSSSIMKVKSIFRKS